MKINITKPTRTSRTTKFLSALTGLALMAAGSPAYAGKGHAGDFIVMPPQFHPYGQSYGIYAQWAERLAQLGPIWFLTTPGFSPVPSDLARFEKQTLSSAKRKFRSAEGHVCPDDHSMPEMVHLVDLILAHQGASDAFSIDASGRVQLTIPNDHDVAALNALRARWDAEVVRFPIATLMPRSGSSKRSCKRSPRRRSRSARATRTSTISPCRSCRRRQRAWRGFSFSLTTASTPTCRP